MSFKRATFVTASLISALALSACGTDTFKKGSRERNPAPCPNVAVIDDVSRMVEFAGDATIDNVAWTGEVTAVDTNCRYFAAEPIKAQVKVNFAFGRGPAAEGETKEVTYFVAVTRTNKDLIQKQEFTIPVKFKSGEDVVTVSDTVNQIVIPRLSEGISGSNFEILVGLSLTKKQVIYNRSGKSLKFPEL